MNRTLLLSFIAVALLSACDVQTAVSPTPGPKQGSGALVGALAGAAIGNQFGGGSGKVLATGAGMIIGAMVGSSVGQQLDDLDRIKLNQAAHQAMEYQKTNSTVEWRNPDSGNYGKITPVRTFQSKGGYCREFQQEVVIGGKSQAAYGIACRQPDGNWQVI